MIDHSNTEQNSSRLWQRHERLVLHSQEYFLRPNVRVELGQSSIRVVIQLGITRQSPVVPQPRDARLESGQEFVNRRADTLIQSRHRTVNEFNWLSHLVTQPPRGR